MGVDCNDSAYPGTPTRSPVAPLPAIDLPLAGGGITEHALKRRGQFLRALQLRGLIHLRLDRGKQRRNDAGPPGNRVSFITRLLEKICGGTSWRSAAGIMTKMTVRHMQGEPMETALAWAESEIEGFMRT